jgi:hypothetical protein
MVNAQSPRNKRSQSRAGGLGESKNAEKGEKGEKTRKGSQPTLLPADQLTSSENANDDSASTMAPVSDLPKVDELPAKNPDSGTREGSEKQSHDRVQPKPAPEPINSDSLQSRNDCERPMEGAVSTPPLPIRKGDANSSPEKTSSANTNAVVDDVPKCLACHAKATGAFCINCGAKVSPRTSPIKPTAPIIPAPNGNVANTLQVSEGFFCLCFCHVFVFVRSSVFYIC